MPELSSSQPLRGFATALAGASLALLAGGLVVLAWRWVVYQPCDWALLWPGPFVAVLAASAAALVLSRGAARRPTLGSVVIVGAGAFGLAAGWMLRIWAWCGAASWEIDTLWAGAADLRAAGLQTEMLELRGVLVPIVWMLEAMLIVALIAWVATATYRGVGCRACRSWCRNVAGPRTIAVRLPPAELEQRILGADWVGLGRSKAQTATSRVALSLAQCRCGKAHTVSAVRQRRLWLSRTVIRHLRVGSDVARTVRRLIEERAATGSGGTRAARFSSSVASGG